MSSKSRPWYRGTAQHVLFWAVATTFFLLDDRVETSLRASLGLAAGITCLAALAAVAAAPSRETPSGKWRLIAYFVGASLLLGFLSLHGAYVRSVGALQAQAIQAVLQTDGFEAFGFLVSNLLLPWTAFWAISLLLLWLTFPLASEAWTSRRFVRPLLLVAAAIFLWLGRAAVTEPLEVVQSYRDGMRELREATAWWRTHPLPPASSEFEGTVIVVLGESISRHHMSLYGYPRETTPVLSALRPHLAVFDDVISSHSSTEEALRDAFTVPGPNNPVGSDDHPISILQLARSAGFETTWLSNQNEFGVWDSPIRILAQQADRVRYHDPSLGKIASRHVFDEAMLPSLDQVLAGPARRKLVVMHMMSTHLPYCWTKPPDFNPLPGQQFGKWFSGRRGGFLSRIRHSIQNRGSDVNCYDNGVRYADRVLGAVIQRASQLREPAAVVYLSDHGEAPLLGTNHDGARHSAYHIEVPFLLWTNDAYRSARGETWRAALENRAKPFSLALLTPTLADLLGLNSELVSKEDSLFDPAFRPRPRRALDGRIRYDAQWKDNDYRENSRAFVRRLGAQSGSVWAHRVNTLGALLEAKRTFSGIEIDVHFDEKTQTFQVRHEYPDIGVRLRDILQWSRDRPNLKIWIDWKNASPKNVQAALAELEALDRDYRLKARILVETGSDAVSPSLAAISDAGFKLGFYLPIESIQAAMRKGRPAMEKLAAELQQVVLRGRFDAVTYDAPLHPFVSEMLDHFLDEHGLQRYSWDLSINAGNPETDPAAVSRLVRDWKLQALLISYPSDFRI